MTKRSVPILVAACLILANSTTSFSWGAGGHMIVASIAYKRLNPTAKARAKKLLAIPINPCDVTKHSPDFVNAAHWGDDVRPKLGFEYAPTLHYVDYPFSADNTPLPNVPEGEQNIIKALEHYVDVLKNSIDTNEQAQALRWVIHFVGDIHQPLHCATRVDHAHPQGDHGGNLFVIKINGADVKLHTYWDDGLNTFPKSGPPPNYTPPALTRIPPVVTRAMQDHPDTDPDLKLDQPFNYELWSRESEALAKSAVYEGITTGQTPSPAYKTRGIQAVRKRVAFGGYRLAALLNAIWPEAH
jgi:hypothetical protein